MNPKLDLKREVSAPCWGLKTALCLQCTIRWSKGAIDQTRVIGEIPVRVRIVTERAWRQIRRALADYEKLDQAAERLLKPKGKR